MDLNFAMFDLSGNKYLDKYTHEIDKGFKTIRAGSVLNVQRLNVTMHIFP